ncbi:MAG: iron export ABC transporter permease subunit FetB [Actinomycetota bacterium]
MNILSAAAGARAVPLPSWWGVALTLLLVTVAGVVIAREQLGLERDLVIAVVRAGVQLIAVGAVLRVLFEHTGVPGSLAWVAGMVVLGGRTAGRRARGLPHSVAVATAGLLAAVTATLGLLLVARVVRAEPRVVVPLGGMIVSASMAGTTIVLARIKDEVASARALIEARLALGLPGRAAFQPHLRLALRSALAPTIDQTKIVGLIVLPGAMTGLIIAGVDPLQAIRYQIIVMYMGLGAASIAGLVSARLMTRQLFDEAHRLRRLTDSG